MPNHKQNRIPTFTKPRISQAGPVGRLETTEAIEAPSVCALTEAEEAKESSELRSWQLATR